MASSENNSDEGGHLIFSNFSSSNGSTNGYDHHIQIEYLKEKYRDVMTQLKTVSNEKQRLERDFQHLKKELENGKGDIFNTYHEYNALKQKYDTIRLRYDEFVSDPTHCIKLCDELKKERNKYKELLKETECEIEVVLSERGTVLKENQKLYDKNESLERELQTALRCRDDTIKECAVLREKMELVKSRNEFKQMSNESSWSKELSESKDKFGIVSENLESANQEIDRLKKALDKAKAEISKAVQETEIAKGRRDWAISEREKIVQERDSVRNLCDEIRKERDTATSKLLAAIRDKDEAYKEIEQLNERLEAQNMLSNSINNNSNTSGNSNSFRNSHYSNYSSTSNTIPPYDIDALQQYDTEVIEIDTSSLNSSSDWGLTLGGDNDEYTDLNSSTDMSGTYVVSVEHDSIFVGKLKPNDIICQINNLDCASYPKRMIYKAIRSSIPQCVITIKRPTRRLIPVQLNFTGANRNHGLSLETGMYVAKIEPNSIAAIDGKLCPGDRIISINKKSMESINNINEINAYINDMRNSSLTLIVVKELNDNSVATQTRHKHNRNATSCTQTENMIIPSLGNVNNNRLSLEFDNNNHFLPATSMMQYNINNNNNSTTPTSATSASTPSSSKSASKLTGMFQKLRDKMHISNHKDSQEHDALAALDSVLDSDDPETTKPMLKEKRPKRKIKDSQDVGTWPRANMIIHSNDNHTGTIVHHRKKERPKLFSIPTDDIDNNNYFTQQTIKSNQMQTISTSNQSNKSNRNSNPIPSFDINRHLMSKYGGDITTTTNVKTSSSSNSGSGNSKNVYSRSSTYDNRHNNLNLNMNRLSLNLSAFNKQQEQNSLDFIPIKSNNSIDSATLVSKSPTSMNFSSKTPSTKEALEFYMSPKISKNLSKYSSDNESIEAENASLGMPTTNTLPLSHIRKQSASNSSSNRTQNHIQGYGAPLFPHPYSPFTIRPSSNTIIPSGDITGLPMDAHISSHHSHGSSFDYSYNRLCRIQTSKEEVPTGLTHGYEGGTFPRKKENQRYRIPSNQSVTSRGSGIKISNGSIDYCSSERASPMPTFQVQVLKQGRVSSSNKRNSLPDYSDRSKPNIGELRYVHIDKSEMALGIKILCRNNGGGVFVSNVGVNSLASKVGLHIGDQLLEVCGINLRKATYELAAHVLRQCGNSITMLVLYNPDIYNDLTTSDDNLSRSGSPTPQNSPRTIGRSIISAVNNTTANTITPMTPLAKSTKEFSDSLEHQPTSQSQSSPSPSGVFKEQPRLIFIETRKCSNLGISLVGGNAYGIFIHGVQKNSIADEAGLRVGDQILEFNETDLQRSTAEHAAFEIAKPADNVAVLVLYNIQKFNQIKDKQGDALYIRVGFDRNCDLGDSELSFTKNEVLYVDNTMFGGVAGSWRAWKLDEYGHKLQCGIIPNKLKVEEELRLLGDSQDVDTTARRGSTSARRSFFKRIKPQRSSSRDSKELASFSNTHLSLYLDSGTLNEEGAVSSYQKVERLEYKYRPVLVLGPLAECVVGKLTIDFPEHFQRCIVNQMRCSKENMENCLQNNTIADYRRRGSIYEYTTMQAIKDNKQCHCILDVCISAVERLHRNQIYPIVLLLRFKSAKQIKDIKDSRCSTDKISAKAAKEMYEHALKLESDYRQYISVVISGVNITHMCTQIKAAVDAEQKKILWVPFSLS